jgi:hypothetical protein
VVRRSHSAAVEEKKLPNHKKWGVIGQERCERVIATIVEKGAIWGGDSVEISVEISRLECFMRKVLAHIKSDRR